MALTKTRKELCVDILPANQALETLIHEYGKLVFHTIYGLTGDWEESQDLTQDTFHQALKALDAARASSGAQFHAKAWLLRIALNTVRMQRRRKSLFRFIPFSHLHDADQQGEGTEELNAQAMLVQPVGYGAIGHDDPAELVAEQDAVQRTMAKLPEVLRVCLLLSVVSGLPSAEIASMLDMKEAAVRQRLARARKQFQQIYAYEGGETVCDTTIHRHAALQPTKEEHVEQHKSSEKPFRLALTPCPTTIGSSYV